MVLVWKIDQEHCGLLEQVKRSLRIRVIDTQTLISFVLVRLFRGSCDSMQPSFSASLRSRVDETLSDMNDTGCVVWR